MPAMAAEKPPLLESATAMIVLRIENRTSCTMQLCRTAFAYGGFVPELPAAEAVAAEQLSIAPMQVGASWFLQRALLTTRVTPGSHYRCAQST